MIAKKPQPPRNCLLTPCPENQHVCCGTPREKDESIQMLKFERMRCIRRFLSAQTGSVTIEMVLWTPIFLLLFGLLADTSLIFGRQAEVLRILQDANRSLAVGHFKTVAAAKNYVTGEVRRISPRSTVTIKIVTGIISSSVSMPATDLTATGLLRSMSGLTVSVTASQMSEI